MLDDPTGLQLVKLASTASRECSPSNPRNVASLAKQEANGMSDGAAAVIAASRVSDRT